MEGGEGCTNSHSSWTQLKNRKKKKKVEPNLFSTAWQNLQHDWWFSPNLHESNITTINLCFAPNSGSGISAPVCLKVWEKSQGKKKNLLFLRPYGQLFSVFKWQICFSFRTYAVQESPRSCNRWFSIAFNTEWHQLLVNRQTTALKVRASFRFICFCIRNLKQYFWHALYKKITAKLWKYRAVVLIDLFKFNCSLISQKA